MKTNSNCIHPSMHPKSSDDEVVPIVKALLKAISESQFAYDKDQGRIDFEIAMKGLSSSTYSDLIAITSNFGDLHQLTGTISEAEKAADVLCACNSTIEQLKYIPQYGQMYYDIITKCCIKKEITNIPSFAEQLGISTRTFHRRQKAAYKELHKIWFCTAPQYMSFYAKSISEQLSF